MGIRVKFWIGRTNGLEDLLLQEMAGFRSWYEEILTDPESGVNDEAPMHTADAIIDEGRGAFLVSSARAAREIDDIVDRFVFDYCDWGPGRILLKPAGDCHLHIRNYVACRPIIDSLAIPTASSWWNLILTGRPIARDTQEFPYNPSDGNSLVSFATFDEVEPLQTCLRKVPIGRTAEDAAVKAVRHALSVVQEKQVGLIVTIA